VYAFAHAGFSGVSWVRCVPAGASALIIALSLAGCAVGPNYSPPPAPVAPTYKELKGWKFANPSDGVDRGDWWRPYHDRGLDELLQQVEISNQNVAAQAAAYEAARAIIREDQAGLLPTATGQYSVTRTRTGSKVGSGSSSSSGSVSGAGISGGSGSVSSAGGGSGTYSTQYEAPINATLDLDVFGRIRRQIESDTAAAQASEADLANVKLSYQSMLAADYFQLRASDSLIDLLTRTVAEYNKTLGIVQNQFKAGYSVTAGDVATAQAQLLSAQAQLENAREQRAVYEHAIAILTGRPPAELTVASRLLRGNIPRIPVSFPSTLLERRPDIADAERTMQQENALIGVREAAYYPDISLSGLIQFAGPIPLPFSAARAVEQLGANGTQILFNGGLTAAQVDAARATYWQSVANYRQTVLTAFQQVEDNLVAIHRFERSLALLQRAVTAERQAVNVYLNQFQAGTVAFTTVVTAELTLLGDEESELTTRQNLFVASVNLIVALGGGWDKTLMPTQEQLQKGFSLFQKLPPTPPVVGTPPDAAPLTPAEAPQPTR
jgi:NodT family efflux transporter outer membrane factor (OMF) lipoprotein